MRSVEGVRAPGGKSRRAPGARGRDWAFLATSALLFVMSAGGTIYWCGSMSGGMPMPGGWTMSMAWMRMPGETRVGAAGSFVGMWILMMMAMMLPSLVPILSSYRRAVRKSGGARLSGLTALAGAGYFFVWAVGGAAAYAVGATLAGAEMRWETLARAVPLATGIALLLAGCVQLSPWKARQLGRCRDEPACGRDVRPDARSAWRHGLRMGTYCSLCCSGFMMILLVTGVMNVWAMGIVAAAITIERLAPRPWRTVRAAGLAAIAAGAFQIIRGLGVA